MVGYLPASGSAGPRDRQTRAPGSARVGNEREKSGGTASGAVEQAADGPAFLGSEQPAKGIGTFPPPCRRYFLSRYGAGDDRRLRHPRACDCLAAIDRFRLPADPVTRHNRRRQDDTCAAAHRYGSCRRTIPLDLNGADVYRRYGDCFQFWTIPRRRYFSSAR